MRYTKPIIYLLSWMMVFGYSTSFAAAKKTTATRARTKSTPVRRTVTPMVDEIKYWSGPENTYITLDFNGAVLYHTRELAGGMGVELVTDNAPYKEGAKTIYVADKLIDAIKVEPVERGCRVTITFTCLAQYEIKKTGKYQNRPDLVIIGVIRPESLREKKFDVNELQDWEKKTNGKIVIIDPGHGGFDYGAVGYGGLREKDIALDLALRLKRKLETMPNLRVFLTREGDYYVSLTQRREKAAHLVSEMSKADKKADIIFVSIHLNAPGYARDRVARGTEIYFLNFNGETDEAAQLVANYENEVDLGLELENKVDDPLLSGVLSDMMLRGFVNESSTLAGLTLSNVKQIPVLVSRGVKSARFAVLKVPVPSVLLEVAFITNPYEARLLQDDGFNETVMDKFANAIYSYFYARPGLELENVPAPVSTPIPETAPSLSTETVAS